YQREKCYAGFTQILKINKDTGTMKAFAKSVPETKLARSFRSSYRYTALSKDSGPRVCRWSWPAVSPPLLRQTEAVGSALGRQQGLAATLIRDEGDSLTL